jgi:hypothetical protein
LRGRKEAYQCKNQPSHDYLFDACGGVVYSVVLKQSSCMEGDFKGSFCQR